VTAGGTAGNWQTFMIRLDAIAATLENYKFPSCSVGNTGIMSLSEKIR
jgi:hypothetical protein